MIRRTFLARLQDGTTESVSGPAIRCTIEGRHRYFVVHTPLGMPESDFLLTLSEATTGLRVCNLRRATRCEQVARRWARESIEKLIADGLGPRLHEQIEARKLEPAQ